MNLVAVGIPTVFFTDANNGCYHTVYDDVKMLDFKKLRLQTHIAFRTALALTETNTPPPFAGAEPRRWRRSRPRARRRDRPGAVRRT